MTAMYQLRRVSLTVCAVCAHCSRPVQSPPSPPIVPPQPSMVDRMLAVPKQLASRVTLYAAFIFAKQPARIKQVLNNVYIDKQNVDDDLVSLLCASPSA